MTPQQWLARQRREVAGRLRLAAWLGVIEGLAIIAQAGLIAWVVHQTIIAERAISTLSLPVALLFGVVLLRPLLQSSRASAGIAAATAVQSRVRERLLRHTEALGPTGAQAVGKGVISSQLTDQVDALEGYFSRYLPQMTIAVVGTAEHCRGGLHPRLDCGEFSSDCRATHSAIHGLSGNGC
jgi:ATP-binding cassette subfamily C protein CydD